MVGYMETNKMIRLITIIEVFNTSEEVPKTQYAIHLLKLKTVLSVSTIIMKEFFTIFRMKRQ